MKSIDEVKEKLQSLGLALKASPLGNFDTNNLEAALSSRRKTSDSPLLT